MSPTAMSFASEEASGDVSLTLKQESFVSRSGKTKGGSWVVGGAIELKEEKEMSELELSSVLEGDAEPGTVGLVVTIIAVEETGTAEVEETGNAEDIPRTG